MSDQWLPLPCPPTWSAKARRTFLEMAERVATVEGQAGNLRSEASKLDAGVAAASHVLFDLIAQGWSVRCDGALVAVRPPHAETTAEAEKERVRRQELLKRDEQLRQPSVRRFVREMEQPREHLGSFVSIFSLMRDGREFADKLATIPDDQGGCRDWRRVIDPYVQPVLPDARCAYTGLRLTDIWRYFRHTWTNQYTSTPGRTLYLLVRDRASAHHPIIGIAALGSAIVQIRERDDWIGWQPDGFLAHLEQHAELRWARWVMRRLDEHSAEIYREDLIEDGLYWPSLWDDPTDDAIEKLRAEGAARRRDHYRFARSKDFKRERRGADELWSARARSDLFRSKRCLALADLLAARRALVPHLAPNPSRKGLRTALADPKGRRAIADVLRRAKAEAVGTEIADLTVCGAVAPYNEVLGGKLVSMLAVSPSVARLYHDRYRSYSSEIASSLAGRSVRRRSNVVFVGTTSLYGSHVSQYNRLRLPAAVLDSSRDLEFRRLGRSRSFGTSHFSGPTVDALVRLSEQSHVGVRVNSIFGEGVNPKLRKVRTALDLLGWPSEQLLQHGRQRVVYGVTLVDNLLPYLLGVEATPHYIFRRNARDDVRRIADWWFERWLAHRVASDATLQAVRQHTVDRPVSHGSKVALPPVGDDSYSS